VGQRICKGQRSPVGVSAHHAALMGSGTAAERVRGLQGVRRSPVPGLCSSCRPDGSGLPAERVRGSVRVKGRPCLVSAHRVALMGQECPLSGQSGCKGQRSPRGGLCSSCRPDGSGMAAERVRGAAMVRRSPVGVPAQRVALMGSGTAAERSEGLQGSKVAPWGSLLIMPP
jgi:hypothetical protein